MDIAGQPSRSWRIFTARPRRSGRNRIGGFTVVELIVVIAISAIIAAVAAPRFFDREVFDERGYANEVAGALRYAQKVAVASGCPVRVVIDATGYAVTQQAALAGHCDAADVSYAIAVRLPSGDVVAGVAPGGVLLAPSTTLTFDALGSTDLPGDRVFTAGPQTFSVEARSGLVLSP